MGMPAKVTNDDVPEAIRERDSEATARRSTAGTSPSPRACLIVQLTGDDPVVPA
jgi:hypothetical protein